MMPKQLSGTHLITTLRKNMMTGLGPDSESDFKLVHATHKKRPWTVLNDKLPWNLGFLNRNWFENSGSLKN